jgi:hypothetical protein
MGERVEGGGREKWRVGTDALCLVIIAHFELVRLLVVPPNDKIVSVVMVKVW